MSRGSCLLLLVSAAVLQGAVAAAAVFAVLQTAACQWAVLPQPATPLCLPALWPAPSVPWLLMSGLILASVVFTGHTLLSGWRSRRRTRRVIRRLTRRQVPLPERVGRVAAHLRVPAPVVVGHSQPIAVCVGLLRPRALLSTGLLELICDDDALAAVLAHEAEHARRHDPLRRLLGRALLLTGAAVPALASLEAHSRLAAEWRADRAAVAATSVPTLAGALYAVAAAPAAERGLVDAPAFCVTLHDRVRHLTATRVPPVRLPAWRVAASVVVVGALAAALGWMLHAASLSRTVVQIHL